MSNIVLVKSGNKRIRCISREAADFKVKAKDAVRGVYIAKKAPYGYIISIEGSYIIGRNALRHVVELDEDLFSKWMRGEEISLDLTEKGIYIVKYGPIFAGSGYYDGEILRNLIPKSRTVED